MNVASTPRLALAGAGRARPGVPEAVRPPVGPVQPAAVPGATASVAIAPGPAPDAAASRFVLVAERLQPAVVEARPPQPAPAPDARNQTVQASPDRELAPAVLAAAARLSEVNGQAGPEAQARVQELAGKLLALGSEKAQLQILGTLEKASPLAGSPQADQVFQATARLLDLPGLDTLPEAQQGWVADKFAQCAGEPAATAKLTNIVAGAIRSLTQPAITRPPVAPQVSSGKNALPPGAPLDLGALGSHFQTLPAEHKALMEEALRAGGADARLAPSLKALLEDPAVKSLDADTRTAVLSQAKNYPTSEAVGSLRRAVQQDWFKSMPTEDRQRALKLVGFASSYEGGDRKILNNTMDRFLGGSHALSMDFGAKDLAGARNYGESDGKGFHLNPRFLQTGNGPLDTSNPDTLELATSTMSHEVNHLLNGDSAARSYDYFMAEYRAHYVGFQAKYGRPPTVGDLEDTVRTLLSCPREICPSYSKIRDALQAGDRPVDAPRFVEQRLRSGRTETLDMPALAHESRKLVDFARQFLGRDDVTARNAATLAPAGPGDPAPLPTGNIDNHGR